MTQLIDTCSSSTTSTASTVQTSTPTAPSIDSSKPTTSVQIRLADGQRLVGTFNHTHTILDIKQFINRYIIPIH